MRFWLSTIIKCATSYHKHPMDCSLKSFPYPTAYTPVSEDSERLRRYSGVTCNSGDILRYWDFSLPLDMLVYIPGDSVIKYLPTNVGDTRDASLIPGSGSSPGVGNSNPLQYSCLENPMDRGACWVTVHGVAKNQTRLSNWTELNWLKLLWALVAQMVKNLPAMQETRVRSLGRFPGEGNGNPLQYSCLENPMDRGACWATVHGVAKSPTQLSDWAHGL